MSLLKNKKFILVISGIAVVIMTVVFGVDEKSAKQIAASCSNAVQTPDASH